MVYIALAVSAVLAVIDQVLKIIVQNNLGKGVTRPVISVNGRDWLNFTYVENTGAGFSILEGCTWFLIVLTAAVMIVAIVLMLSKKIKNPIVIWGLSLVIGGGVGNLIDRVFRGGRVIDYIDLRIINFAVFNFADCCVVVGVVLIFIALLFSPDARHKKQEIADKNEEA